MNKVIYLFISWAWPAEWQEEQDCRAYTDLIKSELTTLCKRHGVHLTRLTSSLGKVHMVIGLPPRLAASRWILLLKMSSSRRLTRELGHSFRWPRDYRMCSLAPSRVADTSLRMARRYEDATLEIPFDCEETQQLQGFQQGNLTPVLAGNSCK